MFGGVSPPRYGLPPAAHQEIRNLLDRDLTLGRGAEVPGLGKCLAILHEALGQDQIGQDRIEHVLPRTQRLRIANFERPSAKESAHRIRYQPALGPVTPADHIAGAHRRHWQRKALVEKARPIRLRYKLGAGLAAAVGTRSPERFCLLVAV